MAAGAIVCCVGVMALFGAVIAPAAFSTLDRDTAGRFVSAVFPRYYAVGAALGGLALLALLVRLLLRDDRSRGWVSLLLVALMLPRTLYAWVVWPPPAPP